MGRQLRVKRRGRGTAPKGNDTMQFFPGSACADQCPLPLVHYNYMYLALAPVCKLLHNSSDYHDNLTRATRRRREAVCKL